MAIMQTLLILITAASDFLGSSTNSFLSQMPILYVSTKDFSKVAGRYAC